MAPANVSAFLRRLTRGMVAETLADQSDRQLVEQFLAGRGEAVFEAIVRRHGAMVYRVCWRVLQHHQDAEDAFQATFLVLAQRLRTVRKHASLASWLHGVAHRLALRAKAGAATRRRHEAQASVCQTVPPDNVSWGEVRAVLDAELAGLPEKWRLPLILCYLEGRTQDEAADQLGWSKRTLRRRLEEGRTSLGHHLSRRGVVWPAALSAVLLSDCVASAALPPGLVGSTVEAATCVAAGQVATAAVVSANVAVLSEGVLQTMLLSKIKVTMAVALVVAAVGVGGNRLLVPTRVAGAAEDPKQVQPKKPQPPQKDKPHVHVIERDAPFEFERQVLFVPDPSSGEFKALTRDDGILVLAGHIEFHVRKLKDAKDDQSVREALKGLEESVQNMRDLLSLPGAQGEKKPQEKKPRTDKPALKPGAAADMDKDVTPRELQAVFADGTTILVRLPQPAETAPLLDKIMDQLGLAGQLAKINAVNVRCLREDAIRIIKERIECDVQNLKHAKDENSMRQALQRLEDSAKLLKEVLSFDGRGQMKRWKKVQDEGKEQSVEGQQGRRFRFAPALQMVTGNFTEDMHARRSWASRPQLQFAADVELAFVPILTQEMKEQMRSMHWGDPR